MYLHDQVQEWLKYWELRPYELARKENLTMRAIKSDLDRNLNLRDAQFHILEGQISIYLRKKKK